MMRSRLFLYLLLLAITGTSFADNASVTNFGQISGIALPLCNTLTYSDGYVLTYSGSLGCWSPQPAGSSSGTVTTVSVVTANGYSGTVATSTTTPAITISGPAIPAAANPSGSVGLSAVNGSASTFMRSDAAPALSQSIAPTWTGNHTFSGDLVALTSAPLTISGNLSQAVSANLGLGFALIGSTPTYTDTSNAGGTISRIAGLALPNPIFTASVATTYTNADALYIPAPTCSTNATCSNLWSIQTAGNLLSNFGNFAGGLTVAGGSVNLNTAGNPVNIGSSSSSSTVTIGNSANTTNLDSATVGLVSAGLTPSGNISNNTPSNGFWTVGTATPTYTDSSSAGGTLGRISGGALVAPTFNATVATTYTNADTLYIPTPACTGNATCTNLYSLQTQGGTLVGGALQVSGGFQVSGAAVNINAASNFAINIGSTSNTQAITIGNSGTTGKTILAGLGSDSTHTSATVCEDTTTHAAYFGSGTLGVCAGTSSARFKHDIEPLNAGLPEVEKLKPVSYFVNADHGDPTHKLYGFTAEDMHGVLPDLVGMDAGGKPNTADYVGLIPVLVKALQEQQLEIEQLKRHHRR